MKKLAVLGLVISIVALLLTAACGGGKKTKPPAGSGGGSKTQSFDGGRVTLNGTQGQLNKIDDVEVIRPGDSRYPQPGQIASGIKKVLIVFEIKIKPGQGSVAPPTLILDDFEIDRNDWDNVTPRSKRLPIFRQVSSGGWTRSGEAWLKNVRPHAQGRIDHASLFAVVEEGEPVVPVTEPPPRTREQVIEEGVILVLEEHAPRQVWINLGTGEPPYPQAADLTRALFEQFDVPAEEIPDLLAFLQRSVDAGESPDAIVLFFPRAQADEMLERIAATGYEGPLFAYTEEDGEPTWWVAR
jgi:hypothetical protein